MCHTCEKLCVPAKQVNPLVLCRVRREVISDTAYDASGWWMLAAAAVAAHVGIREDICAIQNMDSSPSIRGYA